MSVTATITHGLTVYETITTNVDGLNATARKVTHDAFNKSKSLSATSTPSITQVSSDTIALVAGAKTVDLTALPLVGGATLDASALKIVGVLFTTPSANTALITVSKGASNGYTGLGANFSAAIHPDGAVQVYTAKHSGVAAVSGTVKTLDFAGTGTESFNIILLVG